MNDTPLARRATARLSIRLPLPRPTPPLVFEAPRRRPARIQLYAGLWGRDSYANVCGALAAEAARRIDGLAIHNYIGGTVEAEDLAAFDNLDPSAPVGIFFGLPNHLPAGFHRHRVRIGVFACEADQVLPEWVDACNGLDLVAVPSRYCREVFVGCGVTAPVMVVPHGVHSCHVPVPGLRDPDRFVFYNTFRGRQVHKRKGYEELVRCFQRAFQGRDDVVLRIRAGHPGFLPRLAVPADHGGLVEFDERDDLTLAEAAAVYSSAHCVVHPSKAEGFGLVPMEAIACETPVLSSCHTGLADYLDADSALLLSPGAPIRAPRANFSVGRWRAIDEDDLVEKLRHAFEHRDELDSRARRIGPGFRDRHAWPRALGEFIQLVDAASDPAPFRERAGEFRDAAAIRHARKSAGVAATRPPDDPRPAAIAEIPFNSIVYSGWDYPRDGIGNHLRLLNGLVFKDPRITARGWEQLEGPYDPEPYSALRPFVQCQRPDLFRGCLYLDVIGFKGNEKTIEAQVARVAEARRRFDARTAIYLMWETDALWEPMLELVRAYDLVIVTSSLLDGYFDHHGVDFVKVPHPYSFDLGSGIASEREPGTPLTLGVSAGLWRRKNLLPLAERFAAVRGDDPSVRLRIHTRTRPFDDESRREASGLESLARAHANIEFLVASLSRAEYLKWMADLDVYCFLSSGEGYSVTPREALHLKRPVVLLDAHVHREFSHLPGVIRVAPGAPAPARPGFDFMQGGIGNEAGLDLDALDKVLGDIEARYLEASEKLGSNLNAVLAFHDPDRIRNRWFEVLDDHFHQ